MSFDDGMEYNQPMVKKKPTQETPKGHEIPVPTRDDVMRVFKKAAKPDSEKESGSRRPKK